MKDYIQQILMNSGHPLEPFVAFELQKMAHEQLEETLHKINKPANNNWLITDAFIYKNQQMDADWYANYE